MTKRQFAQLISTLYLALSAHVTVAEIQTLDKIAVVINDQVITESELNQRLHEIINRSQNAGVQLPDRESLTRQVVDLLILEKLQLGTAERFDIKPSDEEVMGAARNIMQQRGWSETQLQQNLALENTTINEFFDNLRRELTMQTISQGIVNQRVDISEQEVDNFLASADAKFWISPDYRLQHILIALPSSPSPEDIEAAQNKAQELYTKIQSGVDFAALAIANSSGANALKGGDLGWRKTSQLPPVLGEAVDKIKDGETTPPVKSQAGFHLLKINGIRGDEKRIVKQTKARHILIKPSAILDDESAKQKLIKLRQEILEGKDFAEVAKDISEDIGSRMSGGDLGWASPGSFVPIFEQTMRESDIGEISQPFKSQFGWHIMQVLERRDEDMTDLALRSKARNILISRRFQDEKQIWLQEMRDDAFISYKLPGFENEDKITSEEDIEKQSKKNKKKKKDKEKKQRSGNSSGPPNAGL